MKNIFSKTTEKRTQNGVKSYLSPTFVLSPILIFTFLTLGVGQMWGWTTYYLKSDNTTWEKSDNRWGFNNDGTTTTYMANGSKMKLWRTDWGDNGWFGVDDGSLADNGNGIRFEQYKGDVSYNGYSGMVCFHMNQATPNNSNNDHPWVWITRPTWYLKHNWNNGSWIWYTLTDNQDGTYMVNGQYGGQTTVNHGDNGSDAGSGWGAITASTVGDPKQGDQCRFTFNSSNKSVTITKLCTITYDANGATSGDKPADQTDILYNTPTTVRNNSGSLAKTGYIFAGWNTKPDGTGTTYIAGEGSINPTDVTTTLYAKWTKITITELSASPSYGTTGVKNMTVSFKTNVPRNAGYYYRIAEFGGAGTGTTGNGFHLNGQGINSGTAETLITTTSFPTIYFGTSGTYTSAVEICIGSIVQQRVTFTYTAGDYCTVSFDMQGRGDVVKPQNILSGNTATVPSPEPTATGYTFGGWYENPECTGSAFNFSTAITVSRTLYAKWTPKTTTVTLDQQSGTGGTAKVTATYDAAMPGATMPTRDNYTFNGYFTGTEGSGTKYYNADGTSAKNWDIEDATKTLYAHWTERMSELTTSNHYNVGNPEYAIPAKTASSIGIATTATLTATTPSTGYTFAGWTLSSNLVVTSGNKDTDLSITVRTNGDGAAATAQANYNEDLRSSWHLVGNSSDFPGGWDVNNTTMMQKKTGHSTESAVYFTINVTSKETKDFKIVDDNGDGNDIWYGYSTGDTHLTWTKTSTKNVYTGNGNTNNLKYKPTVVGSYEFKVDYSDTYPAVTITYPTAYTVTYGVGTGYTPMGRVSTEPSISSGDYVIAGTNITFTATPNLGYKFVGWYSNEACTGDAVSTDASYTIASLSADTYLYAKFDYRPLYIHADFAPNGWDTPVQMTQSTENRAVYTYEIDPLAAKSGTPASEGHHFHFVNTVENPNDHKAYNYKGVQTPKGSGFLTNENIHLTDEKNATIQFDLMRKSKITITLTLKSIDDNPKPTVDIAADPYYTVNTARGSYDVGITTINPASVEARSGANSAAITATIAPGYTFVNWTPDNSNITINSPNDPTTTVRATGEGTLIANATANSYTVHFDGNGNTGGLMNDMSALTYGVAFNLTANAFTKTGYTFAGWATEAAGAVAYTDGQLVNKLTDVNNGTFTLYAKWTPNQYTVTLDKQTSAEGYGGNEGTVANQTVTFDATPATVSGSMSMPTAKNGWAFMGFYSATGGNGRRFINPSGEWVTDAGDTIRESKWVHAGDVTLYAYYKKAEITDLIFDAAVVAPSASVGVTPKVDPTPEGTNSICWKLLYNNGNLYTPQPNFENPREIANKVTFTAPNTSGMYLVAAVLRTGTDCNGGTKLDSVTYPFQVAGDHTVTVQYKCGDVTLQGSTSVSARPLDWSGDITAPTITGYTFTRWEAGDGITIKDGETNSNPTHIKAIYDGKLTAVYTQKRMIYFNNTLGWSAVYVYFYENNKYWGYEANAGKGTGSNPNWRSQDQSSCPFKHKGAMTQIEGTNIWYYDCEANSINASYTNVAFNEKDQTNYDYFSDTKVVRRGDYHSSLPMFVPLTGVDPVKMNNNKAEYYNEGYWMNYPENTGYSLHIYKGTAKGERDEIRSIAFPFTADKTMPMEVTLELNANTIYGYEIHRADGAYYAYNGTIKINASSDIKLSADQRGGIKTSAAGDYVFKLNFGNSDGYGYLFSVQYPASEGSYRLVYKDLAEWSQGSAHTDAWSHPSRVIYKNEGAADTVSFFIAKGHTPTIQIQKIKSIDNEGNITWENVGSATSYDNVSAAGVYNFITSQTAGALSIDKVEPYTGNYYIRTDNAGSTKWDNYRAADHQMTYSEFSKDRATNTFGELYTHYYMHWCPRGTNVKFCIANDYSSCITDTLVNDVVSLGNMADAGWLNRDNESEVYRDKFSANIRFMYDERTNKISRAYMSSSTNTDRKFLVLKSNTEFWNSDGTALSGSGESAVEGNYEAIFKDNEDWIYEREIKLTPGQKFKLYASYAQATAQENGSQHFCGNYADNDWENAENYVALVGGSGAPCNVRIIYDFKTNRLLAAMVPSGEISTKMDIYADVMFIREHQGDIEQLIFNGNGEITNIKTAYGVMRFNKWTLNNKDKDTHNPLASPASIYERAMYFISFPFEVKLSEVFGFGTYGQDWIIEYYDGAERARTGWWEGQPGFWRYVWDRKNFVLKPNVGYLLELELGNFKEGSGFWNNKNERLELFFPSSGPLGSIMNSTVNCTIPEHTCYINRHETEGLPDTPDNPRTSYNRTIFDSHWNVMPVPTYVNATPNEWSNNTWTTKIGPKFLYTWNMEDNTLTATSAADYRYHAMHAYMVQYGGNVQWVTSGTKPAAIVARNTYAEEPKEVEFRLEIQQNEKMVDQTFVIMSNDDQINANFQFGEDMSKDFNARNANIYTMTADNVAAAGNSLPMSENTTIVPVGVSVKKTGDYTFSIPDGTNGVGITLIDEETGIRTSLSALDYTVNLAAGDYTERFWLEISPIYNTPTGIEEPTSDSSLKGRAQKRIIDGVLYIVKDGKIFDARGTRVE